MRIWILSAILLSGGVEALFGAPPDEHQVTVTFRGVLTTSSQLFTHPDSPDPIERSQFVPLENDFGAGVELKYIFPETNLAASISAEFIQATRPDQLSGIPLEDGYRVVPVELTAYFILPIGGPAFSLYMGGGGGAYVGERVYRLGGVEAVPVDSKTGFGIHILGGGTYHVTELLSITGEMKFRDLQFDAANQFKQSEIVYEGRVVTVGQTPFVSQVHTDGVIFNLGVTLSF